METTRNNRLTYDEFLAYLLLYAANADFNIRDEELEIIRKTVDEHELGHIREEFERLNDAERLERIMECKSTYVDMMEDTSGLFLRMKEVFLADDRYLSVEKAIFLYLRRLLNL